jgi:hypothetical protein
LAPEELLRAEMIVRTALGAEAEKPWREATSIFGTFCIAATS